MIETEIHRQNNIWCENSIVTQPSESWFKPNRIGWVL